nr:tegument protein UL37 [Equid gammaherpesvirus 5]UTK45538.1 tegument protein UL37 [Equid gammaherpesvirus 5]UTK45618.1 tegument protein UL37 [Equid gammaherpesvirus 5]UTK45697.1 tegument protein UL37 [Equid gammaherpesvirus 5]
MNPQTSLDRVAQRLSDSDNLFKRVRVLVDLESVPLSLRSLGDQTRVAQFLNTVSAKDNDYLAFVARRPAYFLLRVASFGEEVPLGAAELKEATGLLATVAKALGALSHAQEPAAGPTPAENLLENSNIVAQVNQLTAHLKTLDVSHPLSLTPPAPLATLRCVEELTLSYYSAHWGAPPTVSLPAKPDARNKLEQWLVLSHVAATGLVTRDLPPPKQRPDLRALARKLLTAEPGLFVPVAVATETSLTLPLAKERAREIFAMAASDALPGDAASGAPILGFRDADLASLRPEYTFLYEHVFEALCNGQLYGCSKRTVEAFLERCLKFLTGLGGYVQTACSNKSQLSLPEIEGLRSSFYACGLTPETCHTFRTMMAIAPSKGSSKLKHFHATLQHLDQITLFGKYYYECLRDCSPTSISYRRVREVLRAAQVEQNSTASWETPGGASGGGGGRRGSGGGGASNLGWPLYSYLKIFLPRPPEGDLAATFRAVESTFMRSLLGVSIKRDWDLDKFYNITKRPSHNSGGGGSGGGGDKPVSRKQVQKFCEDLNFGDAEYEQGVVQSKYFAPEFTRLKLLPELRAMLSGGRPAKRHVMMFKLRWLVLFAFEDATGLAAVRRPLTLAYFQLTDIFNHQQGGSQPTTTTAAAAAVVGGGGGGAISNLLDNIHETWTAARELVPDAGDTPPTAFLSEVYRFLYAPAAREHTAAAAGFLREIQPVVEGVWHLMRIGATLCHAQYEYVSSTGHLRVPYSERPGYIEVRVEVFKNTVKILEHSLSETLVILSQACQDLQRHYVDCLGILDLSQTLTAHPIPIDLSEPDFMAVKETLLGCLARYREIASLASGSCCYSLTKHFRTLFEPALIPHEVIQKVLDFSEGRDTTDAFVESLQQPVLTIDEDFDFDPPKQPLTEYDLTTLRELHEDFPLPRQPNETPATTPSIKLSYTDAMNVSQINIDWDKFSRTSYIPQDKIESAYSHITVKKLEQLITGAF